MAIRGRHAMLARAVAIPLMLLVIGTLLADRAGAEDLARSDPDGAQELAERYAPVIMLKAQEESCDPDGEPYGPTAVDIVLDNPEVLLRQVGNDDPVVMRAPGAGDLFGLGEGFYVDFPGSALEPGCIYERDFDRYATDVPATVYAHIVQQEDHPDRLALQYWFYWYYNDWNNKHESDWEGIQLLFEASSVDEALTTEPVSIGYAQHEGGERAEWDSAKLERDGTHPFVYSSAGSHASYFGSALYIGRSGSEGFGCDNTDGPSDLNRPDVVVLPDDVGDAGNALAWLAFEGRWGERQRGPFNGPTGPLAKERWLEPVDWHEDLRSSSVVIPRGDADDIGVVSLFCSTVEWGSGTLIQTATSPFRLAVTALLLFVVARGLVRRTDWSEVAPRPLRGRRRGGQIIRAAARAYRDRPLDFLRFGLVFIPAAVVVGAVGGLLNVIPVLSDVLDLARGSRSVSLITAAFAGSFASLAAVVAVNAQVASHFAGADLDESNTAAGSAGRAWARRADLVSGFVRAYGIVFVLLVSFVGIPWGIRQLVRYQLFPQAVMCEGLDGRQALARSSELVRGRWLHTTVMITVFNGLLVVAAAVVGLLILVLVTSIPIWLFSGLTTLIHALLSPLTAAAQTLLYGDAVAEAADGEAAESVLTIT